MTNTSPKVALFSYIVCFKHPSLFVCYESVDVETAEGVAKQLEHGDKTHRLHANIKSVQEFLPPLNMMLNSSIS
ncbi:hypothetical protein VTN77DRAFT_2025 [Rasamsonia byssochlamydoides]|uniref:uncharacterized protein n=1 Tax=Rasamsonia byssochlamydoides TaxID=89139 RepID=UPI003743FB82